MAKLAIFDIDNTLTESRTPATPSMARALSALLDRMPVALISGGSLTDFNHQVISTLSATCMENLYALPTSGAELWTWKNGVPVLAYSLQMPEDKKKRILEALATETGKSPSELSEYIYDRGSQITFTSLGKGATLAEKYAWDPDRSKRKAMVESLRAHVPGVSMTVGGSTSIDFTEEGVDKAFGVLKLLAHLGIAASDAVFVGDALDPGGNDEPVKRTGVTTISTRGPQETERIIAGL